MTTYTDKVSFPVCEQGTSVWPGHEWKKWKTSSLRIRQFRECKNCGFTEERYVS